MTATAVVNITINGQAVAAKPGQTVLEAAEDAGIIIPALCRSPHLKPEGACRVCLVEIEKQRTLQPACTFPVTEGMVVQTESQKVVASRKFALAMIFSERSHYCMFCQRSGTAQSTDCELQRLGYQAGLDSWAFGPNYAKAWPVDATRPYFVMDHARCILCRRCVRACDTVAANHTLGVHQRGARTMICADDDVPFGQSTCVCCGSCLEVCPTGALTDRRSSYMGQASDVKRTKSVCTQCAAACAIEGVTRDNQLLRIESDWSGPSGGLLCSTGRFETLEPKPQRVLAPMVRQSDGKLVQTDWDKALALVASKFGESRRVAGLASARLTNESLAAFACFFREVLDSTEIGLLDGRVPPLDVGARAAIGDVPSADLLIVVGDPLEDQKVVGYLCKRAFDAEAKIIVVSNAPTGLDDYAAQRLEVQALTQPSGVARLKDAVAAAKKPIVLYGPGLPAAAYAALRGLGPQATFLPLVAGTNAAGAAKLGVTDRPVQGQVLYVLAGDGMPNGKALPQRQFTVVQAAYRSAWTDAADVVLPAQVWSEQQGHVINMAGRSLAVAPLVEAPKSIHADWETLLRLSVKMGQSLSYDAIAGISTAL
jgi:formate dehydrogenase major subunit